MSQRGKMLVLGKVFLYKYADLFEFADMEGISLICCMLWFFTKLPTSHTSAVIFRHT